MSIGCSYNCADLPTHEKISCGAFRKGGISSIGILDCDHGITDFTDAAQYTAAIAAGNLKLVEPVKANLPEASEISGPNPVACGSADILDGFDWTLPWTDYNVSANNDAFYEALNLRQAYLVWYYCQDEEVRVVQIPVTFVAKLTEPESNKEKRFYSVVAKWSSAPDDFPVLYTAPAGIFNQ